MAALAAEPTFVSRARSALQARSVDRYRHQRGDVRGRDCRRCLAGSQALQADALDFLGDTLTYGLSLAVIGAAVQTRARAALLKGVSLPDGPVGVRLHALPGVLVLGVPRAEIMGVVGFLALAANVASVLLLMRYKDGDANVRSVWLCSRNDAIGNVAVMIAAVGVWGTATAWPDLVGGRHHGRAVPLVVGADPRASIPRVSGARGSPAVRVTRTCQLMLLHQTRPIDPWSLLLLAWVVRCLRRWVHCSSARSWGEHPAICAGSSGYSCFRSPSCWASPAIGQTSPSGAMHCPLQLWVG